MEIIKKATDLRIRLQKVREGKATIGFVPTMGALHEGHVSLLRKSNQVCDLSVCSIFINPTQFNNADDLKKYPVTIEQDIYTLEKNRCDILFLPGVNDIYPGGTELQERFDLGYLETILEGEFRPGHFQGVCQVVKRLLGIVDPTYLFLGQKDYQQCMVLKKLLQLLHSDIRTVICPTQRETNGLAMSSRNQRLTEQQKNEATALYKTLLWIKENIRKGSLARIKEEAGKNLLLHNCKPDYVEIALADNLEMINEWNGSNKLVALVAAEVYGVRLIDNMLLDD